MAETTESSPTISPIGRFDDDIAPAHLMLQVYLLLDTKDQIQTTGELVQGLRELTKAKETEELMVIHNELFLGLVRERARVPRVTLKTTMLCHLLRQAVVVSCTALDAYLPALLLRHLPTVIRVRGRRFPPNDGEVNSYFKTLSFPLDEVMRATNPEDGHVFLANKIQRFLGFKYLAGAGGIAITCKLLGLEEPWIRIAEHLDREKKDLTKSLKATFNRRHDIIHRAGRSKSDLAGEPVPITYAQAKQGVDTIDHVAHTVDELIETFMVELEREVAE